MNRQTRLIHSDNGTLIDGTLVLNDYLSGTLNLPFTAGQDYFYIGALLPFNSIYFDVGTPNVVASSMKIQVWWAQAWHDVFDILDGTLLSGASLGKSGLVTFVPDNFKGWDDWSRNDTTSGFGLESLNIFDMFWCRISFNNTLTAGTTLKYVGHKFASDAELFVKYPDLNNTAIMTSVKAAKTNWDEQHFAAANEIIDYLISNKAMAHKSQLLDWSLLKDSGVHKCAELIYACLGKPYLPNKAVARESFKRALDLQSLRVDKNANADLDRCELSNSVGELYR